MKKLFLLFLFLPFLLSAENMTPQNKKNLKNHIYKPYKQFLFEVKYDSAGKTCCEYILMKVTDEFKSGGTRIGYFYFNEIPDTNKMRVDFEYDDTSKRSCFWIEYTQVLDNSKYIWLHPPRSLYNHFASYYPFPEVDIPVKVGKKYKSSILFLNEVRLNGKIWRARFKIKTGGVEEYIYRGQRINIHRIEGQAKSKLGKQSFYYLFNEELGFVKWYYNLNNIETLELSLIGVY
jgi:hypothetical protein